MDRLGSIWRRNQFRSLTRFGAAAIRPDGAAGWLDDAGRIDPGQPVQTWITCRMAHVFCVADLLGVSSAGNYADAAIRGLRTVLADLDNGGWYVLAGPGPQVDSTKSAYAHAFVVLAGASATLAGRNGGQELLGDALDVLEKRFWEPESGMYADECSADWLALSPYRGLNSTMHIVEALLAAHDATGDRDWLERATAIADRVVRMAESREWRLVEHYDSAWTPLPDYNADAPNDQFKPYGSTPGHGFEWARLIATIDHIRGDGDGLGRRQSAISLFNRAAADGWDADQGGFVYTVDWHGRPVMPQRFHWVAAEAVFAANTLWRVTGDGTFAEYANLWWQHIANNFVDPRGRSWYHELDAENQPAATTWVGRPDIYHAAQAVIAPELPMAGSVAQAAKQAGPILAAV